jgi:hypothetical protein
MKGLPSHETAEGDPGFDVHRGAHWLLHLAFGGNVRKLVHIPGAKPCIARS